MANVKICTKCDKIGLDQYDFRLRHDKRWHQGIYYYNSYCRICEIKYNKQYNKQYKKDNREKVNALANKRRAIKANAEGIHTIEDLKYIYNHQQGKCPCCGKFIPFEKMTVDHIIPLSWGGSNYASNIQLLCLSCNCSKGNRHATDYRDYIPLFLK